MCLRPSPRLKCCILGQMEFPWFRVIYWGHMGISLIRIKISEAESLMKELNFGAKWGSLDLDQNVWGQVFDETVLFGAKLDSLELEPNVWSQSSIKVFYLGPIEFHWFGLQFLRPGARWNVFGPNRVSLIQINISETKSCKKEWCFGAKWSFLDSDQNF